MKKFNNLIFENLNLKLQLTCDALLSLDVRPYQSTHLPLDGVACEKSKKIINTHCSENYTKHT